MHILNLFKICFLASHGRVRLARFTREDHAYGASRLPKTSENDCFVVYTNESEIMELADDLSKLLVWHCITLLAIWGDSNHLCCNHYFKLIFTFLGVLIQLLRLFCQEIHGFRFYRPLNWYLDCFSLRVAVVKKMVDVDFPKLGALPSLFKTEIWPQILTKSYA